MPKDSKSVLSLPKLKAQNQRNPFDLSFKTVFHMPFGMLLPCGFWRVDEDDYLEINNESQVINDTIIRPAFMRLKTHVDYFFVPYAQLWKPFDNLVTGQNNFDSAAVAYYQATNGQYQVPNSVPMFDGACLAAALNALSKSYDEHGYKEHLGALRLLDLLGYGEYYAARNVMDEDEPENAWPASMKPSSIVPMNLFNLLAYQKIYYDFYRNRRYEDCDTEAYNIDDTKAGYLFTDDQTLPVERLSKMLRVHYRWLKKDYFTQVQPSVLPDANSIGFEGLLPSYGTTGIFPQGSTIALYAVPGASPAGASVINQNFPTGSVYGWSGQTVASASSNLVSNIRLAFAYDKLLRRMRNASGSFSAQMLAQFGVTPKDYRGGEVRFIGGFTNRIMPSDVTSTADYNNTLGKLGGQINQYSQQQKPLKFRVTEKGIVMAIISTSLENDYQSFRIDRANLCRQRFDWFNPAFENLGLAPLYRTELTYVENQRLGSGAIGDESISSKDDQLKVLGFIPRYADQKTHIDEVHGLFNHFHELAMQDWTTQFVFDQEINGQSTPVEPLSIHYLTASPAQFDTVVSTPYNGEWNTDPFKVNMYHSMRVMSNKSVNGETF